MGPEPARSSFLVVGLALGLSGFSHQYALHALVAAPESWPAGRAAGWLFNVIWMIPVARLAFALLLFPTGHVRSRRWRRAGWFIGGAFTLAHVWLVVAATRLWARPLTSPFTQTGSPVGSPAFGADPATSVLNPDCRAHELDNLYVVDTSFFPSIGAVNPALTAVANAIRVGDHLLRRLG
jgi:choline dehydrogenase-like flavoprotein